ncbi:MAG: TonB-dependent receptor [Bacteroidia bacterium]|nr:TonB-dependent receptor [Bacteroidia bacterium]
MHFSVLVLALGLAVSPAGTSAGDGFVDVPGNPEDVVDTLRAVTVVADRGIVISRTDTLEIKPEQNVTDVLHRMPGVSISDNGGTAGLKSVSLRGLGSAHTAIYLDGVRVGNVQSGQTDLGALALSDLGSAVVDYAQNSISFSTRKPDFADGRKVAGRVALQAGSFGTWIPAARLDYKFSDGVALSANASATLSEGDFAYGDGQVRTNNDITQYNAGLDIFGDIERGRWHAKAGWNSSERGTPGSTSWPSSDRQNDRNVFAQGTFQKSISGLYSLNISVKAASDKIDYLSEWGDSDFDQTEFQFNTSHQFRVASWWRVSAAADVQWDKLESTSYNSRRFGSVATLTSAFAFGKLRADIAAEWIGAFDRDEALAEKRSRSCLSPSADLRYAVSEHLDLVAFARRAYRIPTFNELYYAGFGNPSLLPEDAWLTDAGMEWGRSLSSAWKASVKADVFYNKLSNKIISAPSVDDPYTWLPYNIGRVEATGADLSAKAAYSGNDWSADFYAHYSWQSALDRTPDSTTFEEQIPFVAKHTLSASADVSHSGWTLSALWNARMGRYDSSGEMPSWQTLDLSLAKAFNRYITLSLTAKNLCDLRYEIVRYYPVPGRNFLFSLMIAL